VFGCLGQAIQDLLTSAQCRHDSHSNTPEYTNWFYAGKVKNISLLLSYTKWN